MKRISIILLLTLAASSMQAQRIKGSDTVLPVAQQTAERFMALNPDARITVTGGGTGVGISALLDGTTDIAMASRPIKFSEKMKVKSAGKEVEEVIVAYDALAVVVHPSNPVKQLTRQQLEDSAPPSRSSSAFPSASAESPRSSTGSRKSKRKRTRGADGIIISDDIDLTGVPCVP